MLGGARENWNVKPYHRRVRLGHALYSAVLGPPSFASELYVFMLYQEHVSCVEMRSHTCLPMLRRRAIWSHRMWGIAMSSLPYEIIILMQLCFQSLCIFWWVCVKGTQYISIGKHLVRTPGKVWGIHRVCVYLSPALSCLIYSHGPWWGKPWMDQNVHDILGISDPKGYSCRCHPGRVSCSGYIPGKAIQKCGARVTWSLWVRLSTLIVLT